MQALTWNERSYYILLMQNLNEKTLTILDKALLLVRNIGFQPLSISALAKEVGMSKSGLFAHFNSKEKMHMMILNHAAQTFSQDVFESSFSHSKGLPRLRAIINNWYRWYREKEGGTCPFIAASIEYDKKNGPIKDSLKKHTRVLVESLITSIDHCIEEKHLDPDINSSRVAYEIYSYICGALVFDRTLEYEHTRSHFEESMERLIDRYSVKKP